MQTPAADIALLTEARYERSIAAPADWYYGNILRDDELLGAALEELGLSSVRVDWAREEIDWTKFRCAVFRTTWDYFHRFTEFRAWLGRVRGQTRLCNEPAIVDWNLDKHYLGDLEARGVPVVPTHILERGSGPGLHELLEQTGWREAVVKPCVSGSARHTYRVTHANAQELQRTIDRLLTVEALMLQPFIDDVVRSGEDTLMVIGGHVTHAVRKVPKPGDFRVQDEHGGRVEPLDPNGEQVELAERAIAACTPAPVYGRVDMVRDNEGRLAIMELELIEPELWLRNHPPAAKKLAGAIAQFVQSGTV